MVGAGVGLYIGFAVVLCGVEGVGIEVPGFVVGLSVGVERVSFGVGT